MGLFWLGKHEFITTGIGASELNRAILSFVERLKGKSGIAAILLILVELHFPPWAEVD